MKESLIRRVCLSATHVALAAGVNIVTGDTLAG
jgi:hydrogenase maturation factor